MLADKCKSRFRVNKLKRSKNKRSYYFYNKIVQTSSPSQIHQVKFITSNRMTKIKHKNLQDTTLEYSRINKYVSLNYFKHTINIHSPDASRNNNSSTDIKRITDCRLETATFFLPCLSPTDVNICLFILELHHFSR
jgi:hypothetical protein